MATLLQDLRYGFRMLWKNPGFTVVAVLSLSIGIGANTTIFSVVNGILLRPLPGISNPARLVDVHATDAAANSSYHSFSYPDYVYYRDHSKALDGLLAYSMAPLSLNASGDQPERVFGMIVSGNYFDVLGARPALGRFFLSEEDATPDTHPVAVISYNLWQKQFAADPTLAGKTVTLNGHTFTIVGVATENFRGTWVGLLPDIWVPTMMQAKASPGRDALGRNARWLQVSGRLKDDASVSQAQAELSTLAKQLEQANPETNQGVGVDVRPASTIPGQLRGSAIGFMGILMAVVGLVLLIACANVAGMFLARAAARRREMAIRLAMGASRSRIVRQLLTESMLLFVIGGTAGVLVAFWATDFLQAFKPDWGMPVSFDFSMDVRVLGFTLLVSLATGLIFGLAPALQASKPDVVPALKSDTPGAGAHRSRTRSLFVIAQVSISLVLLIGAGLFVRSLQNAGTINPGFNSADVITIPFDLSTQGYDRERGQEFYRQLIERVQTVPGIRAVGMASTVPLAGANRQTGINIEGFEPPAGQRSFYIGTNTVDSRYFQTLEIPVVRGRAFNDADRKDAPRVAVVNETMARKFFSGSDALGKRFTLGPAGDASDSRIEIVGVVKDGKYETLGEDARPYVYFPAQQSYTQQMTLFIRTAPADAANVVATVRREASTLDKNLPLRRVMTMAEQIGFSLIPLRMAAAIVGVLGLLGLLLAAIGIFGIINYSVTQRTREIGIRMALGAQTGDVLRLVIKQGMWLAIIGVGVGLIVALAATRALVSLLYGVSATDPLVFGGMAALLALVAFIASYVPARRATKVDPMIALRYE